MPGLRYADAGVHLDTSDDTKRRIKTIVRSTFGPEVLSDIGLFGGLFAPDWRRYREPVLVASTDSVGTKLKVAFAMHQHDTVGIDIVAHCANDILVQGARPLFFLDYLGMGRHDPAVAESVIRGVAEGCRRIGCALLGGEMAELPDLYQAGEYDLAGTIVGIVDRDRILDGTRIAAGDRVIGLAADGLHTNGYSLARKVLFGVAGYTVDTMMPGCGRTVGSELLQPHRCYVPALLPLLQGRRLKGLAHITGGGLLDNIPRILPDGCAVRLQANAWPILPVFEALQRLGEIDDHEMYRTFNMGIGMAVIVDADEAGDIVETLRQHGESPYLIGEVYPGERTVTIEERG